MGRYSFIIIFFGLIGLIAAIVPKQREYSVEVITDVPIDSITLVQNTIYISAKDTSLSGAQSQALVPIAMKT